MGVRTQEGDQDCERSQGAAEITGFAHLGEENAEG